MAHDHEATLRAILAAFERGDIDAVLAFYDEDAVLVEYLNPLVALSGREAIGELLTSLAEQLRDVTAEVIHVVVDGDRLAAEVFLRGTPKDQAEPVEVRYAVFQEFNNAKVRVERLYTAHEGPDL